ncbi:hypothetical protein SO078_29550 (plasmid) [Sinorhizobium meliloti]|nr:hypothetical protein [Sinorhizobium meliloti]WRQ71365.1 hypothetical protein SO078_29550 [Sinorhizobium meliloti]
MRDRDDHYLPEQRASNGLPVGIMLISMLTIAVYLIVGGAFIDKRKRDAEMYVPRAYDASATAPNKAARLP